MTAKKGKIIELVTASGEIQPEVEVRVSPEVPGEIIELTVAVLRTGKNVGSR